MTERENWLEITLRLPAGELGSLLRSLAGDGTGGNPETARENSAFEPERFEQLRRQEREKTGDPAEELTEAADRSKKARKANESAVLEKGCKMPCLESGAIQWRPGQFEWQGKEDGVARWLSFSDSWFNL